MLMKVLFSTPTWCKGNSSWRILGSCVLNDSKCLHFQHNPIIKLIFKRSNFEGFKGFTQKIYFQPKSLCIR